MFGCTTSHVVYHRDRLTRGGASHAKEEAVINIVVVRAGIDTGAVFKNVWKGSSSLHHEREMKREGFGNQEGALRAVERRDKSSTVSRQAV